MIPQYTFTHPYILCHFAATYTNISTCFVFVSFVQKRVVEGCGVCWSGCVCMLMCMVSKLCCGGCNVVAILSMADVVRLACLQKLWSALAVLELYGVHIGV